MNISLQRIFLRINYVHGQCEHKSVQKSLRNQLTSFVVVVCRKTEFCFLIECSLGTAVLRENDI